MAREKSSFKSKNRIKEKMGGVQNKKKEVGKWGGRTCSRGVLLLSPLEALVW